MQSEINLLISQVGSDRVKENIDHFDFFYIATSTGELVRIVKLCRELEIPFVVFGSSSKQTSLKQNFHGLGIKNRADNLKIFGVKGKISKKGIGVEEALLEADSGVSLSALSKFARQQKLGSLDNLEFESGIIGDSIITHPQLRAMANQIKILDNASEQKRKLPEDIRSSDIILSVIFKLKAQKAGNGV